MTTLDSCWPTTAFMTTLDLRRETIRKLLVASGGRFCRVTFIKKDGTERHATMQPAANKLHVVGDDASESAKQAVATRARNNPQLFNYWDVEKKAYRSLNLDRVTRIAVDHNTFEFGEKS